MMRNTLLFSLSLYLSLFIFNSCGSSDSSSEESSQYPVEEESEDTEDQEENIEEAETRPQLSELAQKGESIFNTNCITCHQMNKQAMVGPGLQGVTEKYEEEWLKKFILNSQEMIKAGDEKAVAIYEEYNRSVMMSFNFSEEELSALLLYLEEAS